MSSVAVPQTQPQPSADWRRWLRAIGSNYLLRRILKAILTIWFVISLTFFLVRLMPGSPVDIYIQELITQYGISYQDAQSQAASLFSIDFDAPLYIQYFNYMGRLLQGDLGNSLRTTGTSVTSIIFKFLPWTLFSVGVALLISFTLGMALGMVMAYNRETWIDNVLSTFASISSAFPNYLLGILLVVFLGVQWKIVNVTALRGSMSPGIVPGFTWEFIKDIFLHAMLPITTYVLSTVGHWMLTMRSSTLSTLGEDYVTVARARGLPDSRIATAYVGRNAALPLVTQLAISVGFIVGGSAVIESLFVYQGIGEQLLSSIRNRDYSVMQGVFLIITISVVLANLLADLLYGVLDPRIRIATGE